MSRLTVGADRLLLIYALVVGWLCIYVPWKGAGRYGEDLGYWFVWNPPQTAASIDLTRLVLELMAATAALVGLAIWREWLRRRRLIGPSEKDWGSSRAWVALKPTVLTIVVGLGLAVVVLILNAIASLFPGDR